MKSEPMNPVVKAKWLEALRSGEYKQATGVLRTSADGYCCLGVLSQLASDEGVVPQPSILNGTYRWTSEAGNSGNMYLIPEVMEWAGLESASGELRTEGYTMNLSRMNDSGEHDFSSIADAIEKNL
jgi:hypothetical protein